MAWIVYSTHEVPYASGAQVATVRFTGPFVSHAEAMRYAVALEREPVREGAQVTATVCPLCQPDADLIPPDHPDHHPSEEIAA